MFFLFVQPSFTVLTSNRYMNRLVLKPIYLLYSIIEFDQWPQCLPPHVLRNSDYLQSIFYYVVRAHFSKIICYVAHFLLCIVLHYELQQ